MNPYEQYMQELAQQMRAELTENGFESLETSEDVSNYMKNVNEEDTTFVVINSTCSQTCSCCRSRANDKTLYLLDKIKKQLKRCESTFNKFHQVHPTLYLKEQN